MGSRAPKRRAADAGAVQEAAVGLGGGTGIALMGVFSLLAGGDDSTEVLHGTATETTLGFTAFCYVLFTVMATAHLSQKKWLQE